MQIIIYEMFKVQIRIIQPDMRCINSRCCLYSLFTMYLQFFFLRFLLSVLQPGYACNISHFVVLLIQPLYVTIVGTSTAFIYLRAPFNL